MERENISPCNAKQFLEQSSSSFDSSLDFFIQLLVSTGNASIGSEIREASVSANDTNLFKVEPSTHGVSRVTPCGNLLSLSFISSFDSSLFTCDSYILILSNYRLIGNFFIVGTASASRSLRTATGFTSCNSSPSLP